MDLIKGVVSLRSVKEDEEVEEIEKAVDISYEMHTTAMRMAHPGIFEREIAGKIEGIALGHGSSVSFPIILSVDGQTLHNHHAVYERAIMLKTAERGQGHVHFFVSKPASLQHIPLLCLLLHHCRENAKNLVWVFNAIFSQIYRNMRIL